MNINYFAPRSIRFTLVFFVIIALVSVEISPAFAAWEVSGATYANKSFPVNSQDTQPLGLTFKSDGSKMYIAGNANNTVYQYSLSTTWDVSTASYDSVSFSVNAQEITPQAIFFKSDGTKMYITGNTNFTYQYSLSSAWDISTASYDSVNFNVSGQSAGTGGMYFKSDGTKLYQTSGASRRVYQYSLSTGWNLSTASYDNVSLDVSGQTVGTSVNGLYLKDDGAKLFIVDVTSDRVHQYTLSTAWDLSTATYDSVFFSVVSEDNSPIDLFFSPDGQKMYISGDTSNTIYQYSLDTTAPTVSTYSPADNATGVTTTANLILTFSEIVDIETGNIVIKKASDDSTFESIPVGDARVTGTGTATITINPTGTFAEQTAYYVQIDATAFDDPSSNSYAGIADTTTWNFTVGDFTAPTVSTYSPADNATGVTTTANLILTFSEIVDIETGNIVIKKASDNSIFETLDVTLGNVAGSGSTTITLNPTADFAYETEYYVTIDATAFDDTAGNSYAGIADTTTWNFTTENTPICSTVSNAATYNSYPTCGVATCNNGYTLSNGGCVASGGGGMPSAWFNPPKAPEGGFGISINNGNELSTTSTVTLTLKGGADTARMAISNFSDFRNASQEIYIPIKIWNFCWQNSILQTPLTCPAGIYNVYVKYYASWGRSSETTSDTIIYKPLDQTSQDIVNNTSTDFFSNEQFTRNLKFGQTDTNVKRLQIFFNKDPNTQLAKFGPGSPGKETDFFGKLTQTALIKFQKANKIRPAIGYFGPLTRMMINKMR